MHVEKACTYYIQLAHWVAWDVAYYCMYYIASSAGLAWAFSRAPLKSLPEARETATTVCSYCTLTSCARIPLRYGIGAYWIVSRSTDYSVEGRFDWPKSLTMSKATSSWTNSAVWVTELLVRAQVTGTSVSVSSLCMFALTIKRVGAIPYMEQC